MKKVMDDILNFFFAPRCAECDAYVEKRSDWCRECLEKTVDVRSLPLEAEMMRAIDKVWSLSDYQGGIKKLIKRLKFQYEEGALFQLWTFVDEAKKFLPEELFLETITISVPLFEEKARERGFNQVERIFEKSFADMSDVLLRVRATNPQYFLSREERSLNVKGAFALKEGVEVSGKKILLLDDIMTSGATLFECAKVLKNAGAKEIYALVLASERR